MPVEVIYLIRIVPNFRWFSEFLSVLFYRLSSSSRCTHQIERNVPVLPTQNLADTIPPRFIISVAKNIYRRRISQAAVNELVWYFGKAANKRSESDLISISKDGTTFLCACVSLSACPVHLMRGIRTVGAKNVKKSPKIGIMDYRRFRRISPTRRCRFPFILSIYAIFPFLPL